MRISRRILQGQYRAARNTLLALTAGSMMTVIICAQTPSSIVRYEPNGPGGAGLVGADSKTSARDDWKATSYYYYKSTLNPKVSSGIWETANFHAPLHTTKSTEFIHLLQGTITLADASGKEEVFHAGDNLLIPRGTEVQWKKTENVKEYWALFDFVPAEEAAAASEGPQPTVIRLAPDGPAGKDLTAHGTTKSYKYLVCADKSFVGVWETEPMTSPDFHSNKYTELMVFLSGKVTLSTPSGQAETFHAGDVALVPRGTQYKWSSDTARKFYAIFDFAPEGASQAASGK